MSSITKIIILSLTLIYSSSIFGSFKMAERMYLKNSKVKNYTGIAEELIKEEMYFSAIPFLKEYIISYSSKKARKVDVLIDKVNKELGGRQFELLPIKVLKRSHAPTIRYILAKKLFKIGEYRTALIYLKKGIPEGHPIKPFAYHVEASILSMMKSYDKAIFKYNECIDSSKRSLARQDSSQAVRQLEFNRDYCIVGISRAEFAARRHKESYSHYLDLSKQSHIWPEILFEEAWNSFYLKDYNRTLGKLVTYNSPVFTKIYNPEIDVLRAMTYLKLCLWRDARKTADDFFDKYQRGFGKLQKMLKSQGTNYKFFYLLAKKYIEKGTYVEGSLVDRLMWSVINDPSFFDLYASFKNGGKEFSRLKQYRRSYFKNVVLRNLKDSLLLQRNLIGAYVRKALVIYSTQLDQSFKGMSFIKLDILSKKRSSLYSGRVSGKKRGDIKNLRTTDKQYFWTFNGEFWADELGDYVFSLKSECR